MCCNHTCQCTDGQSPLYKLRFSIPVSEWRAPYPHTPVNHSVHLHLAVTFILHLLIGAITLTTVDQAFTIKPEEVCMRHSEGAIIVNSGNSQKSAGQSFHCYLRSRIRKCTGVVHCLCLCV
ncbi:hypothetical protein BDV98DRAFT_316304 [Pterulicium gracile]|uniref:Uncharacterized protein n=1 Tax=Pterulicium gracile TaxID=1884261 RepID=A0A5C3QV95_9AGAR|nr:hypothetical protein BDV98DRAFT_316304 [Pterula gracilis]